MKLTCFLLVAGVALAGDVAATRFAENPLITQKMDASLGDNINGPSIIKVPDWVQKPLGKYYMYFAHHRGTFIRMAYADSVHGPWKIYTPGVLDVSATALFRPQPDSPYEIYGVYTHVASPEVYVDNANKRVVMWFHGYDTDGKKWPDDPTAAARWLRENSYGQYTQAAVSTDLLHFKAIPGITKESYMRVFEHNGEYYGIVRLGRLVHGTDLPKPFEQGLNPFRDTPANGKVRHVALLTDGDMLHVFFSVIGAAPEKIQHTTIALKGDWKDWKVGAFDDVLLPEAPYECPNWPVKESEVGEIYGPARQLRDPAVYSEDGQITLFYTYCGEQGIAAADVKLSK
jgi:hypothetical protein